MTNQEIVNELEKLIEKLKGNGKNTRSLWQIIDVTCFHPRGYPENYKQASKSAIDAVIECYEDWNSCPRNVTFPEYLKEKML